MIPSVFDFLRTPVDYADLKKLVNQPVVLLVAGTHLP